MSVSRPPHLVAKADQAMADADRRLVELVRLYRAEVEEFDHVQGYAAIARAGHRTIHEHLGGCIDVADMLAAAIARLARSDDGLGQ